MKDLYAKFWKADEKHGFTGWESKLYFYLVKQLEESEDNTFSVSIPKLAAMVGMSLNTFKPCRKRLSDAGLISFTEGGKGYGQKTEYWAPDAKKKTVKKEPVKNAWIDAITLQRPYPFSGPDFDDTWKNWCFYAAKNKHKELTALGYELFFRDLARLCNSNLATASEILNKAISRGWKAPYPLTTNNNNAGNKKETPGEYRRNVSQKLDSFFD